VLPCLILLGVWFFDCREALEAIAGTTYPGMRRMNGGDLAPWEAMRGWLAPLTIYRSPLTNQSESQAPLALYVPLLLWFLCARKKLKRPALFYAVAGSMLFLRLYQFAGLPGPIAALTGWNRCNPYRL